MNKFFLILLFTEVTFVSGLYHAHAGGCFSATNFCCTHFCCSPEVKQNTASVTQRVLQDVAQTPEFSSALRFQEFVRSAAALLNADAKLHAYLSAVGVDANDATAVAEFMGARDHSRYVAIAERNLSLTQAQADQLVQRMISETLRLISQQ